LRGPEPRVLPLDDPPPSHHLTNAPQPYHTGPAATARSADRALEGAARAEPGHARRRNLDLPTRAGVAPVAGGALGDHERAESGERDATATPERLDDAAALGHADVGDDEVVAATADALEARAPARRDLDAPAGLAEQRHDELAHGRLVLDDEREPPRALDRPGLGGPLRGRQLGRRGDR